MCDESLKPESMHIPSMLTKLAIAKILQSKFAQYILLYLTSK